MERQERREQILNILAAGIRKVLLNTVPKPEELQEIRMRLGQPLRVVRGKEEIVLRSGTEPYIVTKEELKKYLEKQIISVQIAFKMKVVVDDNNCLIFVVNKEKEEKE